MEMIDYLFHAMEILVCYCKRSFRVYIKPSRLAEQSELIVLPIGTVLATKSRALDYHNLPSYFLYQQISLMYVSVSLLLLLAPSNAVPGMHGSSSYRTLYSEPSAKDRP